MRGSRHRSAAAAAAVLLAAVGITVGLLVSGRGGTRTSATTKLPVATHPRRAHKPQRRTSSDAALDRLIRIGLPLYCGGTRGHDVALTFDDGPGPYTKLALRLLRLTRAHATFFLVGRNLAGWPDVPRHELKLAALGDHTWTHAFLVGLPASRVDSELARTQAGIARAASRPVRLFRPPYGAHDAAVDARTHALGMLEVLWSIDSRDSEGASYLQIARNVLSAIRPGSIVLLHENRGQTLRALDYHILPALHRRGLRPVSVPELLARDPPTRAQLRAGAAGCQGALARKP